MEETIIVLMEKEKDTGKFIQEKGSYTIGKGDLVHSFYVLKDNNDGEVYITLTTDKDLKDWEYTAFYDYINLDNLKGFYDDVEEIDDEFNPAFRFKIDYNEEEMEDKLNQFIDEYYEEVLKTYEEIKDLEQEYI